MDNSLKHIGHCLCGQYFNTQPQGRPCHYPEAHAVIENGDLEYAIVGMQRPSHVRPNITLTLTLQGAIDFDSQSLVAASSLYETILGHILYRPFCIIESIPCPCFLSFYCALKSPLHDLASDPTLAMPWVKLLFLELHNS